MATQVEKPQAHAAHLLDGFLGLREKYAMLEPMLFDRDAVDAHGSGAKARGFKIIKNTLFLTCSQEVAKLSLDSGPRSPSAKKIVEAIEAPGLIRKLREQYAVWHIDPPAGETDPDVLAALAAMDKREEAARRLEFDAHFADLRSKWKSLSGSPSLTAFKTMRNKLSAHTDVHLVDGQYKLVDIGKLGIKWKDLRESIESLQEVVVLIGLVVRCSSFGWDSLDSQLQKAAKGFWSVPDEAR